MALVCDITTSQLNPFSFIDCQSINISYEITGLVTVSFTVVSTSSSIDLSSYNELTFGSNNSTRTDGIHTAGQVTYKGFINNYELSKIPGTNVYEHRLSLLAWGCR